LQAVLVLVVELVEAPEHVEGVGNGLLVGEVLLENGEHLFLGDGAILIGVVVVEGMQEFLLKLLLFREDWLCGLGVGEGGEGEDDSEEGQLAHHLLTY
jgi:hypothetical protein